jgi:hypothetical protein
MVGVPSGLDVKQAAATGSQRLGVALGPWGLVLGLEMQQHPRRLEAQQGPGKRVDTPRLADSYTA